MPRKTESDVSTQTRDDVLTQTREALFDLLDSMGAMCDPTELHGWAISPKRAMKMIALARGDGKPDALKRLEAWLSDAKFRAKFRRDTRSYRYTGIFNSPKGGFRVRLFHPGDRGSPTDVVRDSLYAAIHAALEEAERER